MVDIRAERARMSMRRRLGEYLVDAGVLSETQLKEALALQEEQHGFLGQILIEQGWITDKQLCQVISQAMNINCVSIDSVLISEEVISLISNSLAVTCQILPLFVHNNILYLAMENPRDTGVIQLVEYETRMQVKPLMAPLCQLNEAIAAYYHVDDTDKREPTGHSGTCDIDITPHITREIGFGQRKRLGNILVEAGLLTDEQLKHALELQKRRKGFLGKMLVDIGWISEDELCQALSDTLQIESVDLNEVHIDLQARKYVTDSLAASSNIFPLFTEGDTLYIAMENPLDSGVVLYLNYLTQKEIEPLVAPPHQIRALIQKYYPSVL
ncbi:hypothetical protein CSB45_11770 [candidate division KSB3 bacterium]|uniref:Type II secretion system protein GspE N-terminal domain-containing protein n=1 Tax=candidate division KSB3 bacterium TaxID=2044937 RepID=A0A2G6E2Q6_9BACT|nr:MAG: hypothetical protein CSB45_11770 [candidate division KSB3 bacterium]PIE29267.1 MAG: hypothetical protein CSA57_09680 [candidate division KSB3 bacterium]